MSAFLPLSQKRRKEMKASNPEMENTDISRLLGEMWRTASPLEKRPFVEQEKIGKLSTECLAHCSPMLLS